MYKLVDGKLYSGSRLVAEVHLEIFDPHGSNIGSLRGRYIYDEHDHHIGTIRGEGTYDQHLERLVSIKELKKAINSESDPTLAAFWLLLIRQRANTVTGL